MIDHLRKIEHVALAPAPRADLYDAAAANDHRHHERTAFRAIQHAGQLLVTVRTKYLNDGVVRNLVLAFNTETAI